MFNMKPPKTSVLTIVVRNARGEIMSEVTVSSPHAHLPHQPLLERFRPRTMFRWPYWTVGGKKPVDIQGTNAMISNATSSTPI
jgi:hypothetical protein